MARSEDHLVLPYAVTDNYSKTWKPRGHQLQRSWDQLARSPVLRILVAILAIAGLFYTFHSSQPSSGEGWVPRRDALEEDDAGLDPFEAEFGPPLPAPQQQPGVHAPGQQPQQQKGELAATYSQHKRLDFNQLLHRMYEDLPSLREPTPAIFTVSGLLCPELSSVAVRLHQGSYPSGK